jgi:hypothetical protein
MNRQKVMVLTLWADQQGISHFRQIEFDLTTTPPGGAIRRRDGNSSSPCRVAWRNSRPAMARSVW